MTATMSALDVIPRALPSLGFIDSILFVCFCALIVHRIYSKFEFEPTHFLASFFLLGVCPGLPLAFVAKHFDSLFLCILTTYGVFYFSLCLSTVLYRISPFHPLAKYPGPLILKVSKIALTFIAYTGKQHVFFKKLRDTYGPCVRTGPNELMIIDVNAVQSALGTDQTRKGPQYYAHVEHGTTPTIVTVRDVDVHRERRKLWNHGFTTSALKDYEPVVASRVLQLADRLETLTTHDVAQINLADWLAFFTYDFMGDLVFGGGLELMQDGDDKNVKMILEHTMRSIGILEHIPWVVGLIRCFSLTTETYKKFIEFGMKCIKDRQERGPTRKDLFYFISNEANLENVEVPPGLLANEVFAAMVAGADTTSTILGGTFYYLLTHRQAYERLRAEVDALFPQGEGDPIDTVKLAGMPYLNAVINEALRLQPAVPTALQRSPLKGGGGKVIADWFIPENAAVYIPPYVLHRDPRYFSPSPDSFIPERWLPLNDNSYNDDKPSPNTKFVTNTAAFIPFSTGPAICAGKNLALMEMRMVLATLMQRFDFRLAEGYDPKRWENDLQDFFVMQVGKLPVVLTARG